MAAILNLACTIYALGLVLYVGRYARKTYFKSPWAYFEMLYIVLNGTISISQMNHALMAMSTIRMLESFLSIIIVVKLVYFMQLIDEVAPIVNTIFLIFKDIIWFVLIVLVFLFALANSFYLIGQT